VATTITTNPLALVWVALPPITTTMPQVRHFYFQHLLVHLDLEEVAVQLAETGEMPRQQEQMVAAEATPQSTVVTLELTLDQAVELQETLVARLP
jgi:hypothetical protein